MVHFSPGDDVEVDFDGHTHRGEVERHERGWVRCRIAIDPCWDYGGITFRLDPRYSVVCVPERRVSHLAA